MKNTLRTLSGLLLLATGCSSKSRAPAEPDPSPVPQGTAGKAREASWSAAVAKLESLSSTARMSPFSVRVYDGAGALAFSHNVGGYDDSKSVPVASAGKWTTAVTVMAVVESGRLALSSTTGEILGWTGPKAAIRLDQLLSLRAGLALRAGEALSGFGNPAVSLQAGVKEIFEKTEQSTPAGAQFRYGSLPLQVAAAMAEKASGKSWTSLVESTLVRPLGLKGTFYYADVAGRGRVPSDNPVVAGAMVSNTEDYLSFLRVLFEGGASRGVRILSAASMRALEVDQTVLASLPTADTPLRRFFGSFHYASGHWIECRGAPARCDADSPRSSLGAAGWYPWFDRKTGYYALISTVQNAEDQTRQGVLTKAIFDVKSAVALSAESVFARAR